jgi:hypothetical protein
MTSTLELACIYFAAAGTALAADPFTITFDDLPAGSGSAVPAGYAGLQWNNFGCRDRRTFTSESGYLYGMVSAWNIVANLNGNPALIGAGSFDLNSAYLTGAWNDGLQVRVEGFRGGSLAYDNTYTVVSTASTLISFNYLGVDSVRFSSFGGTPHGYRGSGTHFVMDNLTVTVPEPSAVELVGLGVGALMIARPRKWLAP